MHHPYTRLALIGVTHPSISIACLKEIGQQTGVPVMTMDDGPKDPAQQKDFLTLDLSRAQVIKRWIFVNNHRPEKMVLAGVLSNLTQAEMVGSFLKDRGYLIEVIWIGRSLARDRKPENFLATQDFAALKPVLKRLAGEHRFHEFDASKLKLPAIQIELRKVMGAQSLPVISTEGAARIIELRPSMPVMPTPKQQLASA